MAGGEIRQPLEPLESQEGANPLDFTYEPAGTSHRIALHRSLAASGSLINETRPKTRFPPVCQTKPLLVHFMCHVASIVVDFVRELPQSL